MTISKFDPSLAMGSVVGAAAIVVIAPAGVAGVARRMEEGVARQVVLVGVGCGCGCGCVSSEWRTGSGLRLRR